MKYIVINCIFHVNIVQIIELDVKHYYIAIYNCSTLYCFAPE